jgi:hypothetical protein
MQLRAWLDARKPLFKVIRQQRDVDGVAQDKALEVVRQFIVDRRLVLYGGLAVDYALRLKGARIYADDERPDFDVYSADSVGDAYALADLLKARGFRNVSAISGIHVQTMRVRTDFLQVADISYAPPVVFAALPVVMYRDMRVLHPDYQRQDMHLAFCFPFNDPPREDVFHRWRKDLARFALLAKHYPIGDKGSAFALPGKYETKTAPYTVSLAGTDPDTYALHGFAAFALLRHALTELCAALSTTHPTLTKVRAPRVSATAASLTFDAPAGHAYLAVATPHTAAVLASMPAVTEVKRFRPYMGTSMKQTLATGAGVWRIHSTDRRLLSVAKVRAPSDGAADRKQFTIVCAQFLLLHFLQMAHQAADEAERALFITHYQHTTDIVNAATELVAKMKFADPNKFVNSAPFFLSTRTLGVVNNNAAYDLRIARVVLDVGDQPGLAAALRRRFAEVPTNYYPDRSSKARKPFDYSGSELFMLDGGLVTEGKGALADEVVEDKDVARPEDKPDSVPAISVGDTSLLSPAPVFASAAGLPPATIAPQVQV